MTVYLVGAGPGDPSLLTLRAAELLSRADAVVYDRLVDERVLAHLSTGAIRHDAGKFLGSSRDRQREINALLVELARSHECVVRLKGGDPFVFGRGGEEAAALQAAGVLFDVVPGVSSVNGVLASAGIPLTERGVAAGFAVVSGASATDSPAVDWEALARFAGTIVVLMGVGTRTKISAHLLDAGLDPATPVAVVENGTLPAERVQRTTLANLGALDVAAPSVIVVGALAALDLTSGPGVLGRAGLGRAALGRGVLGRPLEGWRVVVTRSRHQAGSIVALLEAKGASCVEVPTIEVVDAEDGGAAMREQLARLERFDWVAFSSSNAVERVLSELGDATALFDLKVAAIGQATAAALVANGVVADLVPSEARGEELARAFRPTDGHAPSVLLPQAAGASPDLAAGLRSLGYRVTAVEAYRTIRRELDERERSLVATADAVTFTSGSTVSGLVDQCGREGLPPVVATIGPATSRLARDLGLVVDVEAPVASVETLVEALSEFAATRRKHAPRRR